MNTIYRDAWKAIKEYSEQDSRIAFVVSEEEFVNKCDTVHKYIIRDYMKKNPKPQLDRHKLAAIIAVCGSAESFIKSSEEIEGDNIFFGRFMVALYVALSFMEDDLNADIKESKLLSPDEKVGLCLPDPVICETKSVNSMARMMYWEERTKTDVCIRVLELANTLFLIEQYTLLMYDVDLEEWTTYMRAKAGILEEKMDS